MTTTETRSTPPVAARAAAGLTGLIAVGSALMAVSHAGVTVPLLAALGPGGQRALPEVATGFAVATVLFAVVAVGAWRLRAWAWAGGLVLHGVALIAATMPWRGPVSGVAAAISIAALAVLATRPGRTAYLGARPT